jgi:hypothetical protein
MKVWAVMERWAVSDDGNDDVDIEAVHLSEAGANANLVPSYSNRERYVVEMEALP